jgi:predicted glycogen debranching enzyme
MTLTESIGREWLETNGIGGFASSTASGIHTRRYHGLLVAAIKPPVARAVLLSKFEEALVIDGRRYELSANRYPGVVYPQGFEYLAEFRLDPFPVFVYRVEDVEIVKTVFMVHGENTTVIEYTQTKGPACRLEVRPLIAFRDYHATTHENGFLNPHLTDECGGVSVKPYPDLPRMYLWGMSLEGAGAWYRNFEYDIEKARGLDYREDLFNPGVASFDLTAPAGIIASTEPHSAAEVPTLRQAEITRRAGLVAACPDPLAIAADQFIVERGEGKTVIAGYPWFTDWGRDTMIALPGLTLCTGRPEIAKNILLAFTESLDRGMLPNRFPDGGEAPEYNTVDATLWFFEAVRAYVEYTGDHGFVREHLYTPLCGVIDWHERGTRYGIRVDADGLLHAGEPGVQLTWMDAKIGDWVVTPRQGKPVEIEALWYNALRIMEDLARAFGDSEREQHFAAMAANAKASFEPAFWNESAGCLYDVIGEDGPDGSMRPNQIFAVSLPHTMVSRECASAVVAAVERDLLTPYGLRSLSPKDPRYRPRYEGDGRSRDSAYHQGTVWPWLLGPFVTAYLKVQGHSETGTAQVAAWLAPLRALASQACANQISEVFDGDAPHRPGGCPAQAWSVAEILRAARAAPREVLRGTACPP